MQPSLWRSQLSVVLLTVLVIAVVQFAGGFDSVIGWQIRGGFYDKQLQERVLPVSQRRMEHDNHWFGVEVLQFPQDLVLYQEVVSQVKPDVIIETGTFYGGLTLYFASLLEFIHPSGKVVTIDYEPKYWNETLAKLDVPNKDRLLEHIIFLQGSSTAPETLASIEKLLDPQKRVLVILDSLHTKEHVIDELKLYSPLVTVGSYLIVNDTQTDGLKTRFGEVCGVLAAIREWLPTTNGQFEPEEDRMRFLVSCAHNGFLKRVR